jgi:ABC-type Mn2+/Zn2+ transport system ATPase subunit
VVVRDFVASGGRDVRCLRCASDGLQTAIAYVPQKTCTRRNTPMNIITNLLAGVVHFLGWLI